MSKKNIVIFIGASILIIAGFFIYGGSFHTVQIAEQEDGPFYFIYVEHRGSYEGFREKLKHVQNVVIGTGILHFTPAGIYYDDPKVTKEEDLRSRMGVLVTQPDYEKLASMEEQGSVRRMTIDRRYYAKTVFPHRSFLSIYLGIIKCYPALETFAKERQYPEFTYRENGYEDRYVMEIYNADTIEYLMTAPR